MSSRYQLQSPRPMLSTRTARSRQTRNTQTDTLYQVIYNALTSQIQEYDDFWMYDITVEITENQMGFEGQIGGGNIFNILIRFKYLSTGETTTVKAQIEELPDPMLGELSLSKADTLKSLVEIIANRALFSVLNTRFRYQIRDMDTPPTYEQFSNAIGLDEFKATKLPKLLKELKESNPESPIVQRAIEYGTHLLSSTDIRQSITALKWLEDSTKAINSEYHSSVNTVYAAALSMKNPYIKYYSYTLLERICKYVSNIVYYERKLFSNKLLQQYYKPAHVRLLYYAKHNAGSGNLDSFLQLVFRLSERSLKQSKTSSSRKPLFDYVRYMIPYVNITDTSHPLYKTLHKDINEWPATINVDTGTLDQILKQVLSLEPPEYKYTFDEIKLDIQYALPDQAKLPRFIKKIPIQFYYDIQQLKAQAEVEMRELNRLFGFTYLTDVSQRTSAEPVDRTQFQLDI